MYGGLALLAIADHLSSFPASGPGAESRSAAGLQHYFRTHYADRTFEHLYHWNSFDTALLIPYFLVMVVLSFYGIHRYQLVYRYYKNRKNAMHGPESHFAEFPSMTVQLPIFNEQFVVDRLLQACCSLDYPADKLEIQVLDDSTDSTVEAARAAVELYHSLGHNIVYIHRVNRHGFKAGALDEGLRVATGEFVAIFDADFVPPKEWLMQVVHHFADPKIGMVQTRWTHLNRDYSFPDPGGSHPAGWPLYSRARRPVTHESVLQFQRHGRYVAPHGDR